MGRCSGGEARVGARRVRKTTCQRRLEKKGPSWYQMLPNVSPSTGRSGLRLVIDNITVLIRITGSPAVVRDETMRLESDRPHCAARRNVDDDEPAAIDRG